MATTTPAQRKARQAEVARRIAIGRMIDRTRRRVREVGGEEFLPPVALDALRLAEELERMLKLNHELTRQYNDLLRAGLRAPDPGYHHLG